MRMSTGDKMLETFRNWPNDTFETFVKRTKEALERDAQVSEARGISSEAFDSLIDNLVFFIGARMLRYMQEEGNVEIVGITLDVRFNHKRDHQKSDEHGILDDSDTDQATSHSTLETPENGP